MVPYAVQCAVQCAGCVRTFFTINQGHAFGAPGRPAPAGLVQ